VNSMEPQIPRLIIPAKLQAPSRHREEVAMPDELS
jgi:hypothetical protein